MNQPLIRRAQPADMPGIHTLVKELALYERAPEQVITTPALFEQDHSEGWFDCLVAISATEEVVGIALYHRAYSTWKGRMLYLDDLVVRASERGAGVGLQLLQALAAISTQEGATRLKWQVLDWNTPAIRFYERLGASVSEEWYNCILEGDQLAALAKAGGFREIT